MTLINNQRTKESRPSTLDQTMTREEHIHVGVQKHTKSSPFETQSMSTFHFTIFYL